MLAPSLLVLALACLISADAWVGVIDCSGMRGEKHVKETWKCDGPKGIDICTTKETNCSDGKDIGIESVGKNSYQMNAEKHNFFKDQIGSQKSWHEFRRLGLQVIFKTSIHVRIILHLQKISDTSA